MKRICMAMIICMLISLTACGATTARSEGQIDTSSWETCDLPALGITMKVPADMTEIDTDEAEIAFMAKNKDVIVGIIHEQSYDACATVQELAETLAASSGEQTETVMCGSVSMAHMLSDDTTEHFVFSGPDHKGYLMMILRNEDDGTPSENAAAVIEAIVETINGLAAETEKHAALQTPREIIGLEADASPDWVVALADKQEATQLFVVAAYENTTAWISLHEKNASGEWKMIMSTPGFIGKNGLGKTKEGDAMSPVGTFSFNRAFGIAAGPGCAIPYVQVDENTYWSGDVRDGMHYNELVSLTDYPDLNLEDSEHIVDYAYQYQYCLNISYNAEGTPGLGSAIFLHCLGDRKPYTGGCVAIPMEQMYFVMQHVSPDCTVIIDTLENLGGSF